MNNYKNIKYAESPPPPILEVTRKSDGKVFKVGDITGSGRIISIEKDDGASGGMSFECRKGSFTAINAVFHRDDLKKMTIMDVVETLADQGLVLTAAQVAALIRI